MSDKMKTLILLLAFLTVSGYSYKVQPRLTVRQIAGPDRNHKSEKTSEQLRDVSVSAKDNENTAKVIERGKAEEERRSEGLTPETNAEKGGMEETFTAGFTGTAGEILKGNEGYEKSSEERMTPETSDGPGEEIAKTADSLNKRIQDKGKDGETLEDLKKISDRMDKVKQEIVEEERESRLVAGISLHKENRGDAHKEGEKMADVGEKGGNEEMQNIENAGHNKLIEREKENHKVLRNLTPPLRASPQPGKGFEIPADIQIITQPQNPPSSPPLLRHYYISPSLLATPTQVPPVSSGPPTPHFLPPSVTRPIPTTAKHISVSAVDPGEARSISLFEDLLTEVLQSPRHHLKQNELEVKASPDLDEVTAKNMFKAAHKAIQTAGEVNAIVQPSIPKVRAVTPKHTEAKLTTRASKNKEPNFAPKSNENNPAAKPVQLTRKPNMTQPTGKPKAGQMMENDTKPTAGRNKASPPPQPQLTKPAAKPLLTTAKTPSMRPTKINSGSKNKTNMKPKEKKKKKDNKTQKPSEMKEEVITPTHFPYFLDNYCPPECACYGRVVQCSDKGVDKIPYGIPYNARYILLMNNLIDSIQLDLLNEYVSMEFLVLSNNRLTDGSIEGAFEGIPALKRLYLDKNLLQSVPTDLPLSLEELRLDSNKLRVMSEAAWARCPGLLVLSLSNNSLGNGSDSLPNAVLSPLSNLRTLNLDHNQLTSVPLGLPLSIKELYLKGNLIEQFREGAFDGTSELLVLDLSANRLTNKGLLRDSLVNATHLESLNLEGNRLKQVPRHLPRSLKTLSLEGNLISSIKKGVFGTLKNLEHLGLARNKIFKVVPGAFRTLPVLHQLDLCHNTLRQVPRQLPHALHSVALTHNKIHSVPRDAFCWGTKRLSGLVRVQLENNLIDMGKLDAQAFRCLRGFQVVHFY